MFNWNRFRRLASFRTRGERVPTEEVTVALEQALQKLAEFTVPEPEEPPEMGDAQQFEACSLPADARTEPQFVVPFRRSFLHLGCSLICLNYLS